MQTVYDMMVAESATSPAKRRHRKDVLATEDVVTRPRRASAKQSMKLRRSVQIVRPRRARCAGASPRWIGPSAQVGLQAPYPGSFDIVLGRRILSICRHLNRQTKSRHRAKIWLTGVFWPSESQNLAADD